MPCSSAVKMLEPGDSVHEHEKSCFVINTEQVVLLCSLESEPCVYDIIVLGGKLSMMIAIVLALFDTAILFSSGNQWKWHFTLSHGGTR